MKELQIKRTETDLHETSELITTSQSSIKYADVNKSLSTLVSDSLLKLNEIMSKSESVFNMETGASALDTIDGPNHPPNITQ